MHIHFIRFLADQYPTRDHYPFSLDLFRHTPEITFSSPVTFFAGENGSGKSTLLEALAHKCGIHIWRPNERGRVDRNPFEGELYRFIQVQWRNGPVPGSFFSAEIFKNFAVNLDDWAATDPGQLDYFGGRSLLTQSHGQSLLSFFSNRYRIKGLYLLDEPETALSPRSQLELLRILRDMSRAGHAQFVVATHSPILLACPDAAIYSFDRSPIKRVAYEDTDYFTVYRDFMNDRERFLA